MLLPGGLVSGSNPLKLPSSLRCCPWEATSVAPPSASRLFVQLERQLEPGLALVMRSN